MAVTTNREGQPTPAGPTYEEIRSVALDVLSGRETVSGQIQQIAELADAVAEVFKRREGDSSHANAVHSSRRRTRRPELLPGAREILREVFWDLFRQGIITLGCDTSNEEFPFFKVSSFGRQVIQGGESYFFHDVSSYEKLIKDQIPSIDPLTLLYLKEAVQAHFAGCLLSSTVMLGVATEHTFLKMLETIEGNPAQEPTYKNAIAERTLLRKFNKFKNILDSNSGSLPPEVKEDLDTNLSGLLSMIRHFRNESGHPSGKIISREQCFVLLHLFIPCCKKLYQLIDFFKP